MHLLGLVANPDHVCYRYRLEAYRQRLAERGWTLEAASIPRAATEWLALWRTIARADVVLLQRWLYAPWWRLVLRGLARRIVFDFDDAVFCRDSNDPKGHDSSRKKKRFAAMVRMVDAVTAGNSLLAQEAARCAPLQRVHRVPTCVDPLRYPLAEHRDSQGGAKLVWIGSQSTMTSLDLARESLATATARLPGLQLRVICDAWPQLDGVQVVPRSWSSDSEAAELAAADVGISWLPAHPWSEGKCGLKVLQYMAAGLPVVANPVGMHCELIENGRTGFLAKTPQQWADCIERLAADCSLRRAMGVRARRFVEQNYSLSCGADRLAAVLDDLVGVTSGGVCRGSDSGQAACNSPGRAA